MHNRSLSNACITQVPGKSHFSPLVSPVVSNFNVCMNPRGLSATAPWFPSMNWDVMDLTAQDRPSSKKDEKLLYRWKKLPIFLDFLVNQDQACNYFSSPKSGGMLTCSPNHSSSLISSLSLQACCLLRHCSHHCEYTKNPVCRLQLICVFWYQSKSWQSLPHI